MVEKKPYNSEFEWSLGNALGKCMAELGKYACLIGGVYFVCKDEPNFGATSLFGVGYFISDLLKEACKEFDMIEKFSLLEKKIKK